MQAKNIVIAMLALALIGAVSFLLFRSGSETIVVVDKSNEEREDFSGVTPETQNETAEIGTPTQQVTERGSETTLGTSAGGNEIIAYHFGNGEREILLIGGVHGGYSPNTSALTNEFVTYFSENSAVIPANLTVTIIPNLNPDGATKTGTAGRFNARTVDLNRNFDCEWSAQAIWRTEEVSGGTAAFSEPEAVALRNYIEAHDPVAALVWFSAEGKVYPSACGGTPSTASVELAATFATAAGYPAAAEFDAYAITGDMVNWMAKQGIPAISVLLTDHTNTEWSKNEAGIKAVFAKYTR